MKMNYPEKIPGRPSGIPHLGISIDGRSALILISN